MATATLKKSQACVVEGVTVMWPLLDGPERMQWVNRLKPLFGDDYDATIQAIVPSQFGPPPSGYKLKVHRAVHDKPYCSAVKKLSPALTNDPRNVTCGTCRQATEVKVQRYLIALSRSCFSMAKFFHGKGE